MSAGGGLYADHQVSLALQPKKAGLSEKHGPGGPGSLGPGLASSKDPKVPRA